VERLIQGGRIVDPGSSMPQRRDIRVHDGLIAEVGEDLPVSDDAEVIDARGMIIIPGLVNAHTHAHANLSRGVADRWTLEDLLNHSPALLAGRTPREQYVSAAIGAIEMLKSGCTSVFDLFMAFPAPTPEGIEAVVRAYGESGMRAVLAPAVADMVFYKTVPGLIEILPDDLRAAVEDIRPAPTVGLLSMMSQHVRDWHGSYDGRVTTALAPTIPGQCTDALLEGCVRLQREHGVGIHTHLAESKMQVLYAQERWGTTPLQRLRDIGALDRKFVGAHGVWLSPRDMSVMGDVDASVAHNPASNLRLGNGIAPVREMLDAGVNVALGSDGSSCSDNQNIFTAMHFAGTIGNVRHAHNRERWLSADDVWRMATVGGCHAMGQPGTFGELKAGSRADIVFLDENAPQVKPMNDAITTMVYAETGSAVNTVMIDGNIVVSDGQVLTLDENALRAEAQEAAERILASNEEFWRLAEAFAPYIQQACSEAAIAPLSYSRYADDRVVAQSAD
jgi:5-methylthioadenosine/S-adenosylhomocysteine deaminase